MTRLSVRQRQGLRRVSPSGDRCWPGRRGRRRARTGRRLRRKTRRPPRRGRIASPHRRHRPRRAEGAEAARLAVLLIPSPEPLERVLEQPPRARRSPREMTIAPSSYGARRARSASGSGRALARSRVGPLRSVLAPARSATGSWSGAARAAGTRGRTSRALLESSLVGVERGEPRSGVGSGQLRSACSAIER